MEENKNEICSMLIRFFNMQAGTSYRCGNEWNQKYVKMCLDISNNDVVGIKDFIRDFVGNPQKDKDVVRCFEECYIFYKKKNEQAKKEEPVRVSEKPTQVTEQQVQYSMGILEQAVVKLISETQAEKIEQKIMSSVEDKVKNFIKDEYGTIERKVNVVVDGKKAEMQGICHEKFETILKFVANNEPVFLTGEAGSGKNVLCKQVADALGLNFYFTNAVTQEYKLTGFTDAMGNYQETQFYKAFTEGGLFMLDEMDASIPEVLVILNAAIANRYFDFPAPIGFVEAHPDFRVVAAGNTFGYGADFSYVGRNQLDGASLDRFAMVRIGYSEAIENSVAEGDVELADFCRDFRKSAIKAGLQIIVSYRAIGRLAKMKQVMDLREAIETCLTKSLGKDDINIIANGIHRNSEYKKILRQICA